MTYTFRSGTLIEEAAEIALEAARTTCQEWCGTFNGIMLLAYPDDTVQHVVERWEYEERVVGHGYKGRDGV